ncbi:MAG: NADH-quinone reductase [Deltaproteobacteria bacterium]|nr:NADH-quinone reductase [Deltaproteobacteria bacterium]
MAKAHIINLHQVLVETPTATTGELSSFRLTTTADPDIPFTISKVETSEKGIVITTVESLASKGHYQLKNLASGDVATIAPSLVGVLIAILLSAMLVQNFVFTRYLGLCVFFGVSRKRETAIGMGVTFTIVGVLSGFLAWVINQFVLHPLSLHFLQIIVFIGIIAFLVQIVDVVLKKTRAALHRKFGIYVVLITTNCIILAVPLLNAMEGRGMWESLALSLGSGLGFALALFLMSSARERADLSPVPTVFRGLPIAFILAGLFALSFLGFSGLGL